MAHSSDVTGDTNKTFVLKCFMQDNVLSGAGQGTRILCECEMTYFVRAPGAENSRITLSEESQFYNE